MSLCWYKCLSVFLQGQRSSRSHDASWTSGLITTGATHYLPTHRNTHILSDSKSRLTSPKSGPASSLKSRNKSRPKGSSQIPGQDQQILTQVPSSGQENPKSCNKSRSQVSSRISSQNQQIWKQAPSQVQCQVLSPISGPRFCGSWSQVSTHKTTCISFQFAFRVMLLFRRVEHLKETMSVSAEQTAVGLV